MTTAGRADVALTGDGASQYRLAAQTCTTGGRTIPVGGTYTGTGEVVRAGRATATVDADTVQSAAQDGSQRVIDARAAERYRGEVEPIDPVAGHIPGAVSAPTTENLDADGRFLPAARLRERFAAYGIGPGTAVATYCGSGVTACILTLGLQIAGLPTGAVYDGSWTEWGGRADTPVETN